MGRRCRRCGGSLLLLRADAKFCSGACRVATHRRKAQNVTALPVQVAAERRFVRAKGKVPLQITGRPASSTNPRTWSTIDEVMSSSIGDGFGVMLGRGLGCYDFDDCIDTFGQLNPVVRSEIEGIPEPILFIERSMSGYGLHVFVEADEGPGRSRKGFERYTRARFIRMTGDRYEVTA